MTATQASEMPKLALALRALSLAFLSGALLSCTSKRNCLQWPHSAVFSEVDDIALREHARAHESVPPLRARILESLPMLFVDRSNYDDGSACESDLRTEITEGLDERPLLYDDSLIQTLKTLGKIADTRGVARVLLDFAKIGDDDVTPYVLSPGELGVPPPRARLRHLALSLLNRSGLFLNNAEVRRFFAAKLLDVFGDDREQLLLVGAARNFLCDAWGGLPKTDGLNPAISGQIARGWIRDIERRLEEPADTQALGLVLSRWVELSEDADRLGEGGAMQGLARKVLDARGLFPLTRGVPGAPRDLVVLAVLASDGIARPAARSPGSPDVPFPSLPGFSRTEWVSEMPTVFRWPDAVIAGRIRDLDDEIARLTKRPIESNCCTWIGHLTTCIAYCEPRLGSYCALIAERAAWTPAADSERFFDALAMDRRWLSCAVTASLAMDGVMVDKRARAALGLLGKPDDFAVTGPAAFAAAQGLARHPWWVDRSADVHAWLSRAAPFERVLPHPFPLDDASMWLEWQPMLDRVVALDSASRDSEARSRARAIVAHWIDLLREGVNPGERSREPRLLLAAVAAAPQVGLEADVRALLAEAYGHPDVAEWIFSPHGQRMP